MDMVLKIIIGGEVITIKNLKQHEIIVYLIMTFLSTWIFWSIAFTSTSLNGPFRIIGSFMPSIMAIIFTGYYDGLNGIKKLLKKLTIWKINPFIMLLYFCILQCQYICHHSFVESSE